MLKSKINPDSSGKLTKLIFTFLLFTFLSTNLFAQVTQEWVSRYNGTGNGNDGATSIAVDDMGNVYVTGNSAGNGTGTDCVTIKYNSNGDTVWVQRYNGPGNSSDEALAIGVDSLGNVYVAGNSVGSGTGWNYLAIKYNSNGVLQWVQTYDGTANRNDKALSAAIDGMGNVHLTGYSNNSDNWTSKYLTIKYNSEGVLQWARTASAAPWLFCKARSIALDNSGNVYVTGETGNDDTGAVWSDWLTIRYNPVGFTNWQIIQDGPYSYNSDDRAYSIGVDNSGRVYVSGRCIEYEYPYHNYVVTLSYGNYYEWDLLVKSFAADNLGNMYVITSSSTEKIRIGHAGPIWSKPFGGTSNAIALDISNNVYVTGSVGGDYATRKYNSSGVQQWVKTYNGPGNGGDGASSIAVSDFGYVYVTGSSTGSGTGNDYATIKYSYPIPPIPAAPLLISPPNNAVSQWINLSLVWNPVEFAYIYRLQLATDPSFINIILDDSTLSDTMKAVTNLSTSTDYYWRVNAKNMSGTGPFSSCFKFTTLFSPSPPVLVSPSNGATLVIRNPLLNWDSSATAVGYRVQVSTDSIFTSTVYDDSNIVITEFQIPINGLNYNTTYYWRVNAKNISGNSPWSTIFHFTIGIPTLTAFNLSSPPNGTLIKTYLYNDTLVHMKWTRSGEGTTYKWKFGSPTIAVPMFIFEANNYGYDSLFSIRNDVLDSLLASKGVLPGESMTGEWAIWAYNSLDSLKSTQTYNIILKRAATFVLFSDSFSTGTGNWIITNNGGVCVWQIFSTPYPNNYTLPPSSVSPVLSADGDYCGAYNNIKSTATVANNINCTGYGNITLDFDNDWNRHYSYDRAIVEASYNGGSTWDTIISWGPDIRNTHEYELLLGASNIPNLKIRFRTYQEPRHDWWVIDNVTIRGELLTGVTKNENQIPTEYSLLQNYPNPFNPSTKIKFDIPKSSYVKLIVYNVLGREIKTLVNEKLNAGRYEVDWDGSDYPSGVYFYRLETEDFVSVKKMVLLK